MSISSALSNAVSGLAAASRRADVVSGNIANALTPGYSRRDVALSERILNGTGAGVNIDGVVRASNPVLTSERRDADGVAARDEVIAEAHRAFNGWLGEPDDAFSLFGGYAAFESSLKDLAETPESIPTQNQVLSDAKALANSFNQLTIQTQDARRSADDAIAKGVVAVNAALKNIAKLNDDIASLEIGGRDASAQHDKRRQLIDEVSKYIPVKEIRREFGKVDLMTKEGAFLLAGEAREVKFTPTVAFSPDRTLANGDLSGISVDGVDLTPGGGALGLREGALAGHFAVRDAIAPEFQAQIDGLARDAIERFSGIDATLAAGAPGLFTDAGAAFDPANETGVAGRIAVNAAVDPDQGGEVWRLRDGLGAAAEGPAGAAGFIRNMLDALTARRSPPAGVGVTTEVSAAEAAAAVSSLVGGARILSENNLAVSAARVDGLRDAELEATAVDTDVELQKLLAVEQAFAANARVIQVADELIRRLTEL